MIVMQLPRVSIGLPVYNGAQFIEEAIQSILDQTWSDFELIISDNGSTDNTEAICRAWADRDPRIRYYRYDVNRGAAWNYNHVFGLAGGEYFKWAPHDDLMGPEHLVQCVARLDADEDVVLAYPKTLYIDAQGKRLRLHEDRLQIMDATPHERLGRYFAHVNLCNPIVGLIRASALRQTHLIGKFKGADYVLLAELAMHGKFVEIPQPLFMRRSHPQSHMQASKTNRDILLWYDTSYHGRGHQYPRLRLFKEYFLAIGRAHLRPIEKTICYLETSRWLLARLRTLGGQYKKNFRHALNCCWKF